MRLIIAIAAALSLATPAAAKTQAWKIDSTFGDAHYLVTCKLVGEQGGMSGPCTTAAGPLSVQPTGTDLVLIAAPRHTKPLAPVSRRVNHRSASTALSNLD